ncbi:MAG: signal peptidase I [Candidatus Wildermuthbacteria bacterium]|nr:signal peptidase I [Candidatus Wildermuthbacteria bacterium]
MKNSIAFIWEIAKIVIIALLIVVPIRTFLFQPFFVKGQSMEPSFENGDYLIIDELTFRLRTPERGEVVVFKYPHDVSQRYIKRIIGLPGETVNVEGGKVLIFDSKGEQVLNESSYLPSGVFTPGTIKMTLDKNQYFVLGDNRRASSDSRVWGVLPKEDIIGRVVIRAWPFAALAKFEAPAY